MTAFAVLNQCYRDRTTTAARQGAMLRLPMQGHEPNKFRGPNHFPAEGEAPTPGRDAANSNIVNKERGCIVKADPWNGGIWHVLHHEPSRICCGDNPLKLWDEVLGHLIAVGFY